MSLKPGDLVRLKESDPLDSPFAIVERVGVRQTRVKFFRLPWTSPEKAIPEMTDYPHEQLEKCRDPWVDSAAGKWSSIEEWRLRDRAVELWMANANGQLGNARTDLLPHQISLVHEVVSRERRRLLIAEEVGMGKTIETGMIVHALQQRREISRCLVICPAGQIRQWQEELESKLRVRFEVYRHDIDGRRAFHFPYVIASLDTAKLDDPSTRLGGESHKSLLLQAPDWDLIVFDEAHRLSAKTYSSGTEKTLNYQLAEVLCGKTRDFLFLTGTPHDGKDDKFRNLLRALEPQIVFERSGEGVFFGDIILKNRKSEARGADGEKLFKSVSVIPVRLAARPDGEEGFHKQLAQYLREGYGVARQDPQNPRNRALGFVMTTFQKLASSSTAAVKSALTKRLAVLQNETERTADVSANEEDAEEHAGEAEEASSHDAQVRHLQEQFMAMEIEMLQALVDFPVPGDAKWDELLRFVNEISKESPQGKVLVFTEYRKTVAFLKQKLEAEFGDGCCLEIMGGMGADAKMEAIREFRTEPQKRFLISTEAGGEGINLQFCHLAVNYDIPWNPFRLVQRTGRIHRIGQAMNMQVFNYRLSNQLDERLTDCHETRVDSAMDRLSQVTGLDIVDIRDQLLGLSQEFIDYNQIYRESVEKSSTRSTEKQIDEGVKMAEAAFLKAYETVFKHSVKPFNPDRFEKQFGKTLGLEDLQQWVADYLKSQRRMLMHRKEQDLYEFMMPDALRSLLPTDQRSALGSFDRLRCMKDSSIQLLAIGHPCIDLLLRLAVSPNSPGLACAVKSESAGDEGTIVTVLVRKSDHIGSSAYDHLCLFCSKDGRICTEIEPLALQTADWKDGEPGGIGEALREKSLTFLSQRYPDLDFLEDRIIWVSLATKS